MVRLLLSILLALPIQHTFSQTRTDVEELTSINQDWLNSYPKKDAATLNRIFADDFVLISPKGTKMSKHDIIANLDKQETVAVKIDNVDVKLLTPDVGLITAYTTFIMKIDGKDVKGKNCYQDVYVKREGKWRAVAAHVTLLEME
ncbi:nuclear transport factor 2 family protein [Chitinophaga filiformis]|uniref:DUF4440 domain-containing protein n=1 Tax=Chitinophaga filiformis TaxID=104663 RepID=A0A1G7QTV8_CHIFI|nr:nuclear transport factor 2 family protein [Chitinophaga filiformis]SDG01923.1 conserved hypothetical protein [Chitinophaga filiformis]